MRREHHCQWAEYEKNLDCFPERQSLFLAEKNSWLSHKLEKTRLYIYCTFCNNYVPICTFRRTLLYRYLIEPPVRYVVQEGDALMNLIQNCEHWHADIPLLNVRHVEVSKPGELVCPGGPRCHGGPWKKRWFDCLGNQCFPNFMHYFYKSTTEFTAL